jgi:hypothetical protein
MRLTHIAVAVWLGALATYAPSDSSAQEGYPLDGTWRGAWGPAGGPQTAVVIVMRWDGERIDGIVNPGRTSTAFSAAQLNPEDWTVHFETTVPATGGNAETVVIQGTLESLGSYHRTIAGTWTQAGVAYPFKIARE